MLTDTQICSAMFVEFPDAKRRTPADVMIFRNRFNNGNLADQDGIPKVKCAEYLPCTHCHKGVRKPRWGEKVKPVKPPVKKAKKVTKKKASRKTKPVLKSGKPAAKKASKRKAKKKKE